MNSIDHLILGCSNLQAGIALIEQKAGVTPIAGGKHPQRGTHNALLSLGNGTYLEILAPDPDAEKQTGHLSAVAQFVEPGLFTWAAGISGIVEIDARLRRQGWETSGVFEGSRSRPDGSVLRWKSVKITSVSDPVIPFLIEWDASSLHPSVDSPRGCILEEFTILHPDPPKVRSILQTLEVESAVVEATQARLRAIIKTPVGQLELN